MQHVFDYFLDRLLAVYGEPKSDNPDGFAKEYARVLEGFEREELSLAADHILESFKYGSWPKINDCVTACEDARRDLSMRKAAGVPAAGVAGTGWRVSDSGRRWYQIEKGSQEFSGWMRFYRENGREGFASFVSMCGRTCVTGPSIVDHGPEMLAYLDNIFAKLTEKRERAA